MTLVLVMGLPAAGKTSMCHQLADQLDNCKLFSFDDLIGRNVPNFDAHACRKQFEATVREYLNKSTPIEDTARGSFSYQTVLVDDNLYLSSMRRPFERMARQFGWSIATVLIECDVTTALARNSQREESHHVHPTTIQRMWSDMEITEHVWRCSTAGDVQDRLKTLQPGSLVRRPVAEEFHEVARIANRGELIESSLRSTVASLIRMGFEGKKLAAAKKIVAIELKQMIQLPDDNEIEWIFDAPHYYGAAHGRLWKVYRVDDETVAYDVLARSARFSSSDDHKDFFNYLQLSIDLPSLYSKWTDADPTINGTLKNLMGIRILDQEPLETLFAFICSANNNIKRISKMVNQLCFLYGSCMMPIVEDNTDISHIRQQNPHLLYDFPTVDEMMCSLSTMENQLRTDGFGYRAGYIAKTVQLLSERGGEALLKELRSEVDVQKVKEELRKFAGIGPKVADCISLMGLQKHSVVPVDTHVFQITVRDYRKDLANKTLTPAIHADIGSFYIEKFGEHAGWAQAVLFNANLTSKRKESGATVKNGNLSKKKPLKETILLEQVVKKKQRKSAHP